MRVPEEDFVSPFTCQHDLEPGVADGGAEANLGGCVRVDARPLGVHDRSRKGIGDVAIREAHGMERGADVAGDRLRLLELVVSAAIGERHGEGVEPSTRLQGGRREDGGGVDSAGELESVGDVRFEPDRQRPRRASRRTVR